MVLRICSFFFGVTRRPLLAACLIAVASGSMLCLWVGNSRSNAAQSSDSFATASQGPLKRSETEVEIVSLKEWGFEPPVITRPPGKFLLVLNNQSQLTGSLTISIVEEKGRKLKDVKADHQGNHRSTHLFDLSPGRYEIKVLEQPKWVCELKVTAR